MSDTAPTPPPAPAPRTLTALARDATLRIGDGPPLPLASFDPLLSALDPAGPGGDLTVASTVTIRGVTRPAAAGDPGLLDRLRALSLEARRITVPLSAPEFFADEGRIRAMQDAIATRMAERFFEPIYLQAPPPRMSLDPEPRPMAAPSIADPPRNTPAQARAADLISMGLIRKYDLTRKDIDPEDRFTWPAWVATLTLPGGATVSTERPDAEQALADAVEIVRRRHMGEHDGDHLGYRERAPVAQIPHGYRTTLKDLRDSGHLVVHSAPVRGANIRRQELAAYAEVAALVSTRGLTVPTVYHGLPESSFVWVRVSGGRISHPESGRHPPPSREAVRRWAIPSPGPETLDRGEHLSWACSVLSPWLNASALLVYADRLDERGHWAAEELRAVGTILGEAAEFVGPAQPAVVEDIDGVQFGLPSGQLVRGWSNDWPRVRVALVTPHGSGRIWRLLAAHDGWMSLGYWLSDDPQIGFKVWDFTTREGKDLAPAREIRSMFGAWTGDVAGVHNPTTTNQQPM